MLLTIDDFETYKIVLGVCTRYKTDVDRTQSSFFDALLSQYDRDNEAEGLEGWLEKQIPKLFPAFTERPQWIQNPQWPFSNGLPMIFVGQIKISNPPPERLHDATVFYVFVPNGRWHDGEIRVVTQQY